MTKIKIIEFIGSPGSGKTTICRAIKEHSMKGRFMLIDEYNAPKSFYVKFFFFIRNFSIRYCFSLLFYIFANNISRKKGMFVYMINLRANYTRFLREHKNDEVILLVDQGLVQGIGSMSLDKGNVLTKGFRIFLGCWNDFEPFMLLVKCNLPVEESAKRLIDRNTLGGKFDRFRGDALLRAMKVHSQLLKDVEDRLCQNGFKYQTVAINTLEPLNVITNQICRHIQ